MLLTGLLVRPNMAEEALFEPEAISVKTSKAESKKTMKKNQKECPRALGQLQKV